MTTVIRKYFPPPFFFVKFSDFSKRLKIFEFPELKYKLQRKRGSMRCRREEGKEKEGGGKENVLVKSYFVYFQTDISD